MDSDDQSDVYAERRILEEFSACLELIFVASGRSGGKTGVCLSRYFPHRIVVRFWDYGYIWFS